MKYFYFAVLIAFSGVSVGDVIHLECLNMELVKKDAQSSQGFDQQNTVDAYVTREYAKSCKSPQLGQFSKSYLFDFHQKTESCLIQVTNIYRDRAQFRAFYGFRAKSIADCVNNEDSFVLLNFADMGSQIEIRKKYLNYHELFESKFESLDTTIETLTEVGILQKVFDGNYKKLKDQVRQGNSMTLSTINERLKNSGELELSFFVEIESTEYELSFKDTTLKSVASLYL